VFVAFVATGMVASAALGANPVVAENQRPGDVAWEAALTADNNFVHPPIDGYAGATSVRPGGTIDFHVSLSEPGRYRIEIVRLGWYGGAGGRRMTCLTGSELDPTCTSDEQGTSQRPPPGPDPHTGEVAAGWAATDHLQVPGDWVSGYYLALLVLTRGSQAGRTAFVPFIVQAPVGDRSSVLVIVPTNTWQAYNDWGGESLYTTPEAVKVSFDRPYRYRDLFRWEYPLLRFLERTGYDASYATDDDVDRDPKILLAHRLDLAAGHGEYWTHGERAAWDAARARGVNLAFLGANTGYWQVRYEDQDRTMVGYKDFSDPEPNPALKTVAFRDLASPHPECRLLGEQYRNDYASSEDGRYFNYTVTATGARDPWLQGAGLRRGSRLVGMVGFEFDSFVPWCHVPPPTVLFHFRSGHFAADALRYRACSGSEVFDAGSLFFSWGLDSFRDPAYAPPSWPPPPGDVPALQQVMRNALADMQIDHRRFDPADAVRITRGGSAVRIAPHVQAEFSAAEQRLGFSSRGRLTQTRRASADHHHAFTWGMRARRSTAAIVLVLRVRTGDIADSARYLLLPNAHGRLTLAGGLSAATCYGRSAAVLTPVFGGPLGSPLRVRITMPGHIKLTVRARGRRVATAQRLSRSKRPVVLTIPAAEIPPGPVTLRIGRGNASFGLAAVRAEDLDDYVGVDAGTASGSAGRRRAAR
jgi:hypothetical protein